MIFFRACPVRPPQPEMPSSDGSAFPPGCIGTTAMVQEDRPQKKPPRADSFSPGRLIFPVPTPFPPPLPAAPTGKCGHASPPRSRFRAAFVAVPASDPTSSPRAFVAAPASSPPLSRFGPTLRRPARSPACGARALQPPCPRSLPSLRACPASRSASLRIPASHSEPGFGRPPRPHSLRIPPPSAATPPASPGSPAHASSAFFPRAPVSGLSGHHFFSPLLCIPPRMPPRALARKSARFSGKFSSVPRFFRRHAVSFSQAHALLFPQNRKIPAPQGKKKRFPCD